MNTCDTCKWWEIKAHATSRLGEILHHFCYHEKLEANAFKDLDGASVNSIDGYGDIITGPKFGCIHWEEKHEK